MSPATDTAPPAPSAPDQVPAPAPAGVSPGDLAQLMAAFNEVTARLSATHESLTAQVERLKAELGEANRRVERSRHLAMLGEMAAGIAHEVRNPLGSIALYARMLRDDLADRPTQRGIAERIDRAVTGLNRVVTDVLAFARETTVTRSPCDAEELLHASVEAAREGTAAWQAASVEVRTPPPALPAVMGDPGLLRQALVNLVRNAVEAACDPSATRPPRVALSARLDATRHTDGSSRPVLALRVHDSGPGFSPDALPRLFTPFFTTRATGTGLGLSIVHRIADAHGGLVLARNDPAPPGGASVDILLPLEHQPAAGSP